MRCLIAFLNTNVCVAATVFSVMMSVHALAAEDIPGAMQVDPGAMQKVCESSTTISIDPKGHFQCTVCPSYTDFHGNRESFDLQEVYRGRFSTTNAEQLLLVLSGCETHASGFGGSILLTRDGTAWKTSGYFKGDKPSKCLSFKDADGLDRLVCEEGDMHFGTFASWINAVTYKGNSLRAESLIKDIGGNTAGGSPVAGFCYEQNITAFEKLQSGNGFTITITQTKELAQAGEDSCGFNTKERRALNKEAVDLRFLFDGNHFVLASESKGGLQKVENFLPHQ